MKQYLMLELYSGSKTMADAFKELGFKIFTVDINKEFDPDLVIDILRLNSKEILNIFGSPHIIWGLPPCTTFSRASIGTHWKKHPTGLHTPITDACKENITLVEHTLQLITELNPVYWFIENPRGMIKHVPSIKNLPLAYKTNVTYCSYGEKYMKPTYIIRNAPITFKKPCKEGNRCHESTPSGSKQGIQGIDGSFERAKLPKDLCNEVAKKCKNLLDKGGPQIPTIFDFKS